MSGIVESAIEISRDIPEEAQPSSPRCPEVP